MESFKIDKKGYNPQEVEKYISSIKANYENQLKEQKQTLMHLKKQNDELSSKLNVYIQKDGDISSALVMAVQTAKEIEDSAKKVYELEIKRIKLLYSKWQAVLRQITAIYPNINSNSSVYKLFKDFERNIASILEKESKMESIASEQGHIDDKAYAKSLLQRIKQSDYTPKQSVSQQPVVQIKRAEQSKQQPEKKVAPKTNTTNKVSEFEKFMNSEFDDFNAFQSGNTNYKSSTNLFEANLISPQQDEGFDLKEALTPKEDLSEIMKSFNLDDD